jgi:CRP-like cAMP-binding protein
MVDIDKLRQIYKFGKELSIEDAGILIKSAKSKSFKKKEIIIEEGTLKKDVYFIRSGLVRAYCINDKGDEITFGLIAENQILTNIDIILFDQPSRFYYECIEDTKTFSIDFDKVQNIIERNPKLERNRKFFARNAMKKMLQRLETFVLMNAEERYEDFIKNNPTLSNRVPDKYLANVLGITPVSLSRIRARIVKRKKSGR